MACLAALKEFANFKRTLSHEVSCFLFETSGDVTNKILGENFIVNPYPHVYSLDQSCLKAPRSNLKYIRRNHVVIATNLCFLSTTKDIFRHGAVALSISRY